MNSSDRIIQDLNGWRAELVVNIADEPPFTDDVNGPVRNLPPLEGDDLIMLKGEIERLLSLGWSEALVCRHMKYAEEVCPFWTEEHALKQMKFLQDRAILQGARGK